MAKDKVLLLGEENLDPNSPYMLQAGVFMHGLKQQGVEPNKLDKISQLIQEAIVNNVPAMTLGSFSLYFSLIYAFMIDYLLAMLNHHEEQLAKGTLAFFYRSFKRLCGELDMLDENGNLKE